MTGEQQDRAVTDPRWEDELRAGMAAEGDAGSVEPELAALRFLLHARAPAELGDARQDAIWREIDAAIAPVPWWRRRLWIWGAPVLAAAAAVLLVVALRPDATTDSGSARSPSVARVDGSLAEQLEGQFAALAPGARATVARRVDASRGNLRGELLAMARGGGTQGGAP